LEGAADTPEVTVVVPTRNRRRKLGVTLAGVLRQRAVSLEVVVVDDGSEDGTREAVLAIGDERIRVLRHPESRGVAAARNAGIDAARGAWVAFLDDDDLWAPDKLRRQLDAAQAAGTAFAWAWAIHVDELGRPLLVDEGSAPEALADRLRARNVIPAGASNLLVRREALEAAGGFRPELMHFADWDLWKRLAEAGVGTVVPQPLVAYVEHGQNMRARHVRQFRRELRTVDRAGGGAPVADFDRGELLLWMAAGYEQAGSRTWALLLRRRVARARGDRWAARNALRAYLGLSVAEPVEPQPQPPAWLAEYAEFPDFGDPAHLTARPALAAPGLRTRLHFLALLARVRVSGVSAGVAIVLHRTGEPDGRRRLDAPLPPDVLERQLRGLGRFFRAVPASGLRTAALGRRRGQRVPVAVTFDDDLASHLQVSAPSLRARGLPATFFLTGAGIAGAGASWWQRLDRALERGLPLDSELLPDPRPWAGRVAAWGGDALDAVGEAVRMLPRSERDELSELLLAHAGPDPAADILGADDISRLGDDFEIGFHTLRHDSMTALDPEGLAAALQDGRAEIEALAGRPLTTIAYPHGDADPGVAAAAARAGYEAGFTTAGGAVHAGTEPLLEPRIDAGSMSWPALGIELLRAVRSV
jgi:GT2 family glycosyltransferase/peptidoglycan/xylan/chitin deacetylase (PgdA/CDA1 family)